MADLPKGHWIHAAMAKEKARVGKKGKGKDAKSAGKAALPMAAQPPMAAPLVPDAAC